MILFLSAFWEEGMNHLPAVPTWFALIEGKDVDIMYQIQHGWSEFIKTGRVWALIIGLIIGYVFRGFSSF